MGKHQLCSIEKERETSRRNITDKEEKTQPLKDPTPLGSSEVNAPRVHRKGHLRGV